MLPANAARIVLGHIDREELGLSVLARVDHKWAARVIGAPLRKIDEIGRASCYRRQASERAAHAWYGAEQSDRVRVARAVEEILHLRALDHGARVHRDDPIGQLGGEREI